MRLWRWRPSHGANFGDELSEVIVRGLLLESASNGDMELRVEQCPYPHKEKLAERGVQELVAIGSIMAHAPCGASIWGTGVRRPKSKFPSGLRVHAVRGPISRVQLFNAGISCPAVYGDPALLLPEYYEPSNVRECQGKMGIIPQLFQIDQIMAREAEQPSNSFFVINPKWDWSRVVDCITSCSAIISSSLHGLIVADAYDVPNTWLDEFPLQGGHFKFIDYFLYKGANQID